jgi:hypothetical protein
MAIRPERAEESRAPSGRAIIGVLAIQDVDLGLLAAALSAPEAAEASLSFLENVSSYNVRGMGVLFGVRI